MLDASIIAIAAAAEAIANAVAEENKTDRFLAETSAEYLNVLIQERISRKQFFKPLMDLLEKLNP